MHKRSNSWGGWLGAIAMAPMIAGPVFGAEPPTANCYTPIAGGWQIRLTKNPQEPRPAPESAIGIVQDDGRLHRRPLYPPADKTLIWDEQEREKLERYGFRPLILAYNEPRFLFDFHSAGGLLGHLFIGLSLQDGPSAWFHQWSEIDVRYENGRMAYTLRDPAFPGIVVRMCAMPMADSAGLLVKLHITDLATPAVLTWAYGGASAFFTNWAMTAPEFTYAPEHCAKNRLSWQDGRFVLRRAFDESDAIMKEPFAAARHLSGWEAVVRGGASWNGLFGFGEPKVFAATPVKLAEATQWCTVSAAEATDRVAVAQVVLSKPCEEGYIVVGMGGIIENAIAQPQAAEKTALERLDGIAARVRTRTPDPYLDAAATMMAFATEGTWGDSTWLHGAWSWRFGYLGWRGWYGPTCYGWTDRVRRSIQNYVRLGLIKEGDDAGGLTSLLDMPGGVFYNMNEVFLDHVRQYFEYTHDIELMREIFPVLCGIIEWENRRLQPENADLYENALNTWISDSHWYIRGQCTQASAYMLRAHTFMSDLAFRLGQDGGPYADKAFRIRQAMQGKLWMQQEGVFAEYLDTRGNRLLHHMPELPTIYHAAEFGACDFWQIDRMLDATRRYMRSVTTPGGGKLFWSSKWHPNNGRSYTHSTYEMTYGENLNLALAYYIVGRADEAYPLIRASLCGIFNGPTPGGLSCHAYVDGRQRANDEFADAISMWDRTLVEGVFGILPKRPDGYVLLAPNFPSDWQEASIETPHFSYAWERRKGRIKITWESPADTAVRVRLALRGEGILATRVDGQRVDCDVESGPGLTWITVKTACGREGVVAVEYVPAQAEADKVDDMDVCGGVSRCSPEPPETWIPPNVPPGDLSRWALVDLSGVFNATITEALEKVAKDATPPPLPASQVGFDYWRSHLGPRHHGDPVQMPSDAAWRAKVGPDGVAWTTDGIPFKTSKEGPNIGIVTLAGGYPSELEFPVADSGGRLYLMLSGMTFPTQSHVPQIRVTLRYKGGDTAEYDLVSPEHIGDCWSTWCGRWHDTPLNGFENLGGRFGPAGSLEVADLTKPINVDTEAHLVGFPVKDGSRLESVRIEAVANDVIFGLMGATFLK